MILTCSETHFQQAASPRQDTKQCPRQQNLRQLTQTNVACTSQGMARPFFMPPHSHSCSRLRVPSILATALAANCLVQGMKWSATAERAVSMR